MVVTVKDASQSARVRASRLFLEIDPLSRRIQYSVVVIYVEQEAPLGVFKNALTILVYSRATPTLVEQITNANIRSLEVCAAYTYTTYTYS